MAPSGISPSRSITKEAVDNVCDVALRIGRLDVEEPGSRVNEETQLERWTNLQEMTSPPDVR